MRLKSFGIFFMLLVFFFISISLRAYYFKTTFGGFIPYSAESASHFYYAQRHQEHKVIPALDKTIQYPEGLYVFKKTSIFMEYPSAWLYNAFFKKITAWDFQTFTRYFTPFFYSFSIFAVFMASFFLTRNAAEALFAAVFLALSRASVERSSGFEFLSENFSLPFIFFHFAFVLAAFQSQKRQTWLFLASGFFLSIALASWKITQFYLLLFSLFLVSLYLMGKNKENGFKNCAHSTTVFCVLTGLLTPYLREGIFLLTAPCLLLYFTAFCPLPKSTLKTRCILLTTYILFILCAYRFFLPDSFTSAMYSHVYSMLFYKIKFLLHKPENALLLPAEVRAFWVPPFLSPSWKEVLNTSPLLIPIGFLGCFSLIKHLFRGKIPVCVPRTGRSEANLLLLFMNAAFLIFYVFFTRMRVFLIFFSCLSCIFFLHGAKQKHKALFVIATLLILFTESYHTLAGQKSFITGKIYNFPVNRPAVKLAMPYENGLLEAVKKHTRAGDIILTRWSLSTMLHAYTGRKIVLHAFFESPDIREKNQKFNELLFSDEDKLFEHCKFVWHATILVLAHNMIGDSPDTERYMANVKQLQPAMAVVKLLNQTPQSKHFNLLYENPMFRMFRIVY